MFLEHSHIPGIMLSAGYSGVCMWGGGSGVCGGGGETATIQILK